MRGKRQRSDSLDELTDRDRVEQEQQQQQDEQEEQEQQQQRNGKPSKGVKSSPKKSSGLPKAKASTKSSPKHEEEEGENGVNEEVEEEEKKSSNEDDEGDDDDGTEENDDSRDDEDDDDDETEENDDSRDDEEEEDGDEDDDEEKQVVNAPKPFRKKLVEGEPGTMTGRPLRLYADGIFDLFHFGHAKALQQCKQAYPNTYLLVGCNNDEMTHRLKGRTVMTDKERYESLRHCKWVDEVIEDAPWVLTDEFLEKHNIDYVCHDSIPYTDASGQSSEGGDVYAHIKKIGKFLETQRTDGISTSDLIIRIISQYDTFIRRNLQRGYSGKDMKVPFIKEQTIKFDIAVDKVKDKVKHEVDEFIHKWLGKADEVQHSFVNMFSRDGRLRTSFRKRRRILREKLTDFAREGLC